MNSGITLNSKCNIEVQTFTECSTINPNWPQEHWWFHMQCSYGWSVLEEHFDA